jgi:RNA polymerase sigma-70 factor (ECF subfamily)
MIDIAIVQSELLRKIDLEIKKLPDQRRQIFEMTFYQDMTAGDIAKKLGITVTNVTTQRSRALQFLRGIIKPSVEFWR